MLVEIVLQAGSDCCVWHKKRPIVHALTNKFLCEDFIFLLMLVFILPFLHSVVIYLMISGKINCVSREIVIYAVVSDEKFLMGKNVVFLTCIFC